MKYFFIVVLFSFFLISCGEKDNKVVVNDFVMALSKGDFAKAKELSTPETYQIIEVVEKEYVIHKDKINDSAEVKIEIIEVVEVEKAADYKVRIIIGDQTKEVVIKLVLINDVYVVEMPKEEIVIFQYIIFRGQYSIIVVIEDNTKIIIKTKTKKNTKKHKSKKKSS